MVKQALARSRPYLAGDIWGGFAAMLVALPSAIAFGVTIFSPLGAEFSARGALAGMLGVTILGLVAGALGGTQRLISAPCAPAAAVLSALTIQLIGQGHPAFVIVLTLFLAALVSSVIQISFGFMRIGQLIKYMPFPVVSGYLSGVGLIVILSQLPKWLAIPKGVGFIDGLLSPYLWQGPSVCVGLVTAAVMAFASRFKTSIPAVIMGLAAGLITYWILAFTLWPQLRSLHDNPYVIGPISISTSGIVDGMSELWAHFRQAKTILWEPILVTALTLSVLLSIDTLKTCLVLDAMTGSKHDSNRELVGQGLGNLASTLFGGAPGAGTMGASLVNKASGGMTGLSSIIQGLWSLLVVLFLTPLIAWVPVSALAAILVVIGFNMIDWHTFQLLRSRDTWLDFLVIALVVLVANTISLIAASGLGVALAILMFIREQIHSSPIRRKSYGSKIFSKRIRMPAERAVLEQDGRKTVIIELQGSLFFGTTDQVFASIEPELEHAQHVLLDLHRVQSLDFTAGHMIERVANMLAERNGVLALSRIPERLPNGRDLHAYIDHIGLSSKTSVRIFREFSDALEWFEEQLIEDSHLPQQDISCLPIGGFDLFRGLDAKVLEALEKVALRKKVRAGTIIFTAGEAGHDLMLIARGEIKIDLPIPHQKPIHLATLGRGQFFGEMSFLDAHEHSADVSALTDVDLISLNRTDFVGIIKNEPEIGSKVLRALAMAIADRLRHANSEMREMRIG
jgi:SulP family sulfate permease